MIDLRTILKPKIVLSPNCNGIRAVKCLSTIDGPNMWNLESQDDTGEWISAARLSVEGAESLIGITLPRYADNSKKEKK